MFHNYLLLDGPQRCKDQILMLIDCELAYMNTNHEDFIGFAKYVCYFRDYCYDYLKIGMFKFTAVTFPPNKRCQKKNSLSNASDYDAQNITAALTF